MEKHLMTLTGEYTGQKPRVRGGGNPPANQYWEIPNVIYRGREGTGKLMKGLLDNGSIREQGGWADFSDKAMKSGGFYTPDFPLFYAFLKTLKAQGNEEAREFVRNSLMEKYLMTLTRIQYQPNGNDKIIHNYGTSQKHETDAVIVGSNGKFESADNPALRALLGTDDGALEMDDVFSWMSGIDTRIWRVNKRPDKLDERVGRLYLDLIRSGLDCEEFPNSANASLGVMFSGKGVR